MELTPVTDLPEIRPGDDIAALVADRADLEAGDVLTVASTIVSKAEGRMADLEDYPVSGRAEEIADRLEELTGEEKDPRFAQAVLEESTELLIDAPFLLTETRFGHISVNAGIDRSNVPNHDILLLPKKPTESAERIRSGLAARRIEDVAVIVTDTCGRPFRHGQRGVALGWAGMPASRDWRGELDRDGHELGVTVQSVVDELASAANLVTGEGAGGTPAVVVRDWAFGDHAGSDELFRSVEDDLVRQALREWSIDD
ncbi:coenzyme F420-0:L-glutamate ligase [Natronorubrum bangense]|uniref:Coenzyme F420:L-glutamate ligase n=2 Tax=Natronorubrum bangense TaxID=61858 RepID=L9WI19_9EURY|nr:coenzyme F420-0:L-glutamate ligase [Natronorubrum bangense]ELY49002.1 F420-0--gamma-glutamyl ligase [Natronorubrum bangense JCM 10635]QCC54108.1 coenzyme F420-0:L-glutamate ligase [Natronorubrum bangense]